MYMKQADFIIALSQKSGLTEQSIKKLFQHMNEIAVDALKSGDKIPLFGLWLIKSRAVSDRKGFNPKTREPIVIKGRTRYYMQPSQSLKDLGK